jgi:glycine/D-amino acid oxidase-like deaminating enzyme
MTGWRPVSRRLTNFGSYVVLTEPVPELLAGIGWTGGEAIVDGRMFLHYFRTTEDGRVLMGSASGPIGFGGRVDRRFTHDAPTVARAEQGLRRLLPGLAAARVERAWGGPIDVSADHVPFFGTVPGTRVHYGAGYSGNGVGPSWLGGQILASLALGSDDEWSRSPLVTRRVPSVPPEPMRRLGGGLVRWGILSVEDAEDAGRHPPPGARLAASLPRRLGLRVGTR